MSTGYPVEPIKGGGWKAVDELLVSLAKRSPDLRVVFMGSIHCPLVMSQLPLAESKGLLRFDSRLVEDRFLRFVRP